MVNVNIGNDVVLELTHVTEIVQRLLNGRDDAYAYSMAAIAAVYKNALSVNNVRKEHPEIVDNENFSQLQSAIYDTLPDYSLIAQVLEDNPILLVDPVIDNLVNDTSPAIEKFKMPYEGFFINKKFPIDGGFVAGVFVYDSLEIAIQVCKKRGQHAWRRNLIHEREKRLKDYSNINDDTLMAFIVYRNGSFMISYAPITTVLYSQNGKVTYADPLGSISPVCKLTDEEVATNKKLMIEIEKTVFHYAVNIANLMNLHSDPANPRNPKRDLQITPTNLKNAQGVKVKKIKNVYKIHVGGKIRKYAEGYNEAVRRNGCLHAVQVRGHFRTFHSERYTKMYGKTIWILPFIRGADRELRQRIIEIIE